MRDVLNLNQVDFELNDYTVISFDKLPEYDKEEYDINNPKEFEKYILDIKRDARNSFEYHQYMSFLKENLDMNKCSFLENIPNDRTKHIKIEIHHDPFTIEDIIRIVVRKRQCYCEAMDVEQVSKEVLFLHYNLMVGLIPLSATVHELVGNNYLFVPTTHIFGNYKAFVQSYNDFIDPEMIAVLNRIEEATINYDESRAQNLLSRHYIYLNIGDSQLPSYAEIVDMMKEKLQEIGNKPIPDVPVEGLRKGFIKVEDEEMTKIDLL